VADRKKIIERIIASLHQRLQAERQAVIRSGKQDAFAEHESERAWAEHVVRQWIADEESLLVRDGDEPLTDEETGHVVMAVADKSYGLGLLDRLMRDENVSDIHVMGHDHTMLRMKDGSWMQAPGIASSPDELLKIIQTAAARHGGNIERRFDHKNPQLNMQLRDGSRLFAVRDVVDTPQMVIRKHDHNLGSLKDLVETGMMTPQAGHFLETVVKARLNMVIVGSTGSGKTTILRALCACMPSHEHKVTIEEAREIGLERNKKRHPLVRAMEVRPPDMSGEGGVDAQALVRMSLRMDPDRIILGEVRGGEALQMLTAMTQGQAGSICTMHGDSAAMAYPRLQLYVKFGGLHVPDEDVAKLITDAVHFVVFAHKEPIGGGRYRRVIDEIVETRGRQGSQVSSNPIANRDNDQGVLKPVVKPSERTMPALLAAGLNYDYWMSDPDVPAQTA
jgi:pilus assembly protein CpaF